MTKGIYNNIINYHVFGILPATKNKDKKLSVDWAGQLQTFTLSAEYVEHVLSPHKQNRLPQLSHSKEKR